MEGHLTTLTDHMLLSLETISEDQLGTSHMMPNKIDKFHLDSSI